ncbi:MULTISPECIES: TetR-like C-terminal domain-containing protein [Bacillaceae]|uniref:TetR family transcriptional regulator n=1 Tax=Domibacillus aminovorans TaxID=29332 RepID=A0A177KHS1_9BACI|nr:MULTISPECIES: TetR-like C-terminal domain-containing protein [Bacillaceae]OAH52546.1 TetR family transcriptional regulator [Domibacillus aminovorans]
MAPRAGIDVDTVLQKAVEIIDRDGYEDLSIGKLAGALSIRPPSLYNHIGGLSELKQRLAVFGCGKLYEQMIGAAVGLSGDEAVYALSLAYVYFARQHPGLYEATFRAPDLYAPDLREAQEKVVQIVVQVMAVYKLDEETILHMVRGLRSMLHGFTSIEQTGGFGLPLNLDESFHMMIKTFLKGLPIKK